jgi:hypothetical protein
MDSLTVEQKDDLASMMLQRLEVAKTPTSAYDVAIKSYVDSEILLVKSSATQSVTDLLDGAPDNLNTLREIAQALANDSNLASTLTNQISNVQTAVTSEATSRAASDATLNSKVESETVARIIAVDGLTLGLTTANTDRLAGDASLRAVQTEQAQFRLDADLALESKITDETALRQLDVSNLNFAISEERTRAEALEGEILTNLSLESEARVLAIEGEQKSRDIAVLTLESKISDEVVAREDALGLLDSAKFEKSDGFFEKRSDGNFAIGSDAFLYIGAFWRIRANADASTKRLEFEYSATGEVSGFKTAVPFIRGL